MYKFIIILLLSTKIIYAQEQVKRPFKIIGDVQQITGLKKVYIYYSDKKRGYITDSATLEDGKFNYSGIIGEPTLATLRLIMDEKIALKPIIGKRNMLTIFLEPAEYKIVAKDWLSEATITGSTLQIEYMDYQSKLYSIYKKMEPYNLGKRKLEANNDINGLKITKQKLDSLAKVEEEYMSKFVASHPNSPVSLIALTEYTRSPVFTPPFKKYFDLLNPALQRTTMGQNLKEKLDLQSFLTIGSEAPNFLQPDTSGKVIQLKNYRGKYVFVDFWASWCGPCRLEIPFIKKVYQRYPQRDFQILSVSIDSSREKWLKAIAEDGTGLWPQLGDMQGNKNSASTLYKIKVIPQNLLIDPEGKIIAKNLYGLELETALGELLN
ncbi:TlpA disulfide reductase family protein [Pedobacter agri]|uniref:TlpA disulfide reductase family protein n=1 Tax=Pedobacter agri TaxID=454586 RepID=UPI002930E078|nr:TlpA disulfide reductase family protein [Pedobacter agri]